jgi:hypothetical protein
MNELVTCATVLLLALMTLHLFMSWRVAKETFAPTASKLGPIGVNDKNKIKDPRGDKTGSGYVHDESLPSVDGTKDAPRSLSMFSFNECSPDCCPNQYTCGGGGGGCVCETEDQRKMRSSRGFNRTHASSPDV